MVGTNSLTFADLVETLQCLPNIRDLRLTISNPIKNEDSLIRTFKRKSAVFEKINRLELKLGGHNHTCAFVQALLASSKDLEDLTITNARLIRKEAGEDDPVDLPRLKAFRLATVSLLGGDGEELEALLSSSTLAAITCLETDNRSHIDRPNLRQIWARQLKVLYLLKLPVPQNGASLRFDLSHLSEFTSLRYFGLYAASNVLSLTDVVKNIPNHVESVYVATNTMNFTLARLLDGVDINLLKTKSLKKMEFECSDYDTWSESLLHLEILRAGFEQKGVELNIRPAQSYMQ